jgi:hypothetical protein
MPERLTDVFQWQPLPDRGLDVRGSLGDLRLEDLIIVTRHDVELGLDTVQRCLTVGPRDVSSRSIASSTPLSPI